MNEKKQMLNKRACNSKKYHVHKFCGSNGFPEEIVMTKNRISLCSFTKFYIRPSFLTPPNNFIIMEFRKQEHI